MRIYLYNSYKGSPVGFIMGMIEGHPDGSFSAMTRSGIPAQVRNCFEEGLIKNVLGNLNIFYKDSSSATWLLLLKDLEYAVPGSEEEIKWYINIAIETDDPDELENWLGPGEAGNAACLVAECLEIDKSNPFGFGVSEQKLSGLLKKPFAAAAVPQPVKESYRRGCALDFQKALPEDRKREFLKKFLSPSNRFGLSPIDSIANKNWVLAEKKSPLPRIGLLAILSAIFLSLIIILMLALQARAKGGSGGDQRLAAVNRTLPYLPVVSVPQFGERCARCLNRKKIKRILLPTLRGFPPLRRARRMIRISS